MATRTLYFLRHGQYDAANGGVLTLLGREQARLSAAYLGDASFDAIWASTLPRARETADIVATHFSSLRVRYRSHLREGLYSKVEGHDVPASVRRKDRERANTAYAKLIRPSRVDYTELVVCHGNLIRYFMCLALAMPTTKWVRMATNHCGITRFIVRDTGAVRVVSYNETSHLPAPLVT